MNERFFDSPLRELPLDEQLGLLPLDGVLDGLLVDHILVKSDVDRVARGHQVVVVDDLGERKSAT